MREPLRFCGRMLVVLLVLVSAGLKSDARAAGPLPTEATVVAVFDGDTVQLETGHRVRYLGIDSPEMAHDGDPADCYADEAKKANTELTLHKRVKLQFDAERFDSHGRVLAYVILPDGKCANEEMVKSGLASVFRSSQGFTRFDSFLARQREAIRNHRGLWGNCPVKPAPYYPANKRSHVFHRPECPFGKQISTRNRVRFEVRRECLDEGYSPCRRCKP